MATDFHFDANPSESVCVVSPKQKIFWILAERNDPEFGFSFDDALQILSLSIWIIIEQTFHGIV